MEDEYSSVIKDDSKKKEILNLFKPNFSITINSNEEIHRNPIAVSEINPESIELTRINKSKSSLYFSKIRNEAILQSKGLAKANIKLSKQIMKLFNANLENELNYENSNTNNNISETFHYVNSFYFPKFTVHLSPSTIQLNPDIIKRLKDIISLDNIKEKRKKLLEIYNLYGVFVATGFVLGGKYDILTEAKNEEENNKKLNEFKNKTNFFMGEQKIDVGYEKNNENKINNTKEDLSKNIEIEGGDVNPKNVEEWKKSLNLNNLEIIEYLNIQKIYTFCGDDKISKQIEELEENLLNEQNEIKKEKEKQIIAEMKEIEVTIGILGDNNISVNNTLNAIKNIYNTSSKKIEDYLEISYISNILNEDIKIRTRIMDTRNEPYFIKKCDGFILNLDPSNNEEIFSKIKEYKELITNATNEDNPILLIVNESNIKEKVNKDELKKYCNENKIKLHSGLNKYLYKNDFKTLIENIMKESAEIIKNKKENRINNYILKEKKIKKKTGCFN